MDVVRSVEILSQKILCDSEKEKFNLALEIESLNEVTFSHSPNFSYTVDGTGFMFKECVNFVS